MNLCSGLNQILEVSSGEEVAEVNKFTVIFVLNYEGKTRLDNRSNCCCFSQSVITIYDSVSVLSAADSLAVNDNVSLRSDNGEGNQILRHHTQRSTFTLITKSIKSVPHDLRECFRSTLAPVHHLPHSRMGKDGCCGKSILA